MTYAPCSCGHHRSTHMTLRGALTRCGAKDCSCATYVTASTVTA